MLPKRASRSALPQRRQSIRPQVRRQIIALNHPIVWSGAAVLLLSGLFVAEYWQPQSAANSSNSNTASARRNNPLLQGSSNGADNSGMPDLPLPVLPEEAASQSAVPIDPALRSPTESSQNPSQPNPSTAQPAPRSANDPSLSLYNPMGIPLPRAWENLSNPAQPSDGDRSAATTANPTANPQAVSPLQSALDRMRSTGNSTANSPQPTQAPDAEQGNSPNSLGNGIPQSGTIVPGTMGIEQPNPEISQPSYAPTPQTTGYTMPPAFRTPANSSPSSSPTSSPIASPEMPSTLPLTPAPVPQSNLGQATQSSSSGAIGGREINSFSNP